MKASLSKPNYWLYRLLSGMLLCDFDQLQYQYLNHQNEFYLRQKLWVKLNKSIHYKALKDKNTKATKKALCTLCSYLCALCGKKTVELVT